MKKMKKSSLQEIKFILYSIAAISAYSNHLNKICVFFLMSAIIDLIGALHSAYLENKK